MAEAGRQMRLLRPRHLESIGGPAIPMRRRHAADQGKLLADHTLSLRIEVFIPKMDAFHDTDNDAVLADLKRPPLGAFLAGRGLHDTGRGH